MSQLTFSQSERRNFLGPILIAFAVLCIAFAGVFHFLPPKVADLTVTRTAILPTHTVFRTDSKLVGQHEQAQDDLYVLTTVRIDDRLHVPLFISDITATLTTADDNVVTTSAIQKGDLDNLYVSFPALKPLSGPPLLRESTIQPGDHAEGMAILHFPLTEADWNSRKSATVTIDFYHQGQFSVTIPEEQGTGNSR